MKRGSAPHGEDRLTLVKIHLPYVLSGQKKIAQIDCM
mgnify:FL=1